LSLAKPASQELAYGDLSRLMKRGRRLLVIAGIAALAFLFTIIFVASTSGSGTAFMLVIGDYVITLGIAIPGLILYVLRVYTNKSIRRGNPKVFSNRAKLELMSISWVALVIVLAVLITRNYA
jgi:hypothetical protein